MGNEHRSCLINWNFDGDDWYETRLEAGPTLGANATLHSMRQLPVYFDSLRDGFEFL